MRISFIFKTYRLLLLISSVFLIGIVALAGFWQANAQRRRPAKASPAAKPKASPTPLPKPTIEQPAKPPEPKPTPTPQPAPGDLDTTFDRDGLLTLTIGTQPANAWAAAVQPDGKIVVAGDSHNGSNRDITVVRFTSNGSLDTGFGVGGKALADIGGNNDVAFSVAIQPDGKIVVAGYSDNPGSKNKDIAVVRYATNGSLDASFDSDGIVTTDFVSNEFPNNPDERSTDEARAMLIQPDGKIVVAGSYVYGSSKGTFIVRYSSDGSLDKSFDHNGMDKETRLREASGLALQKDGKLVLVGSWFLSDFRRELSPATCRYNPSGGLDLDKSFGYYGCFGADNVKSGSYYARAVAIQPDGKILVAVTDGPSPGFVLDLTGSGSSKTDFMLVRHNTDGSIDKGFGKNGTLIAEIALKNVGASSLVVQSDGKIVVGGSTNNGSNDDFAVARFTSNGSMDPTWGKNGIVRSDFDGHEEINAITIQPDRKVIAAGSRLSDFALARYLNPEKAVAPPAAEVTKNIELTSGGYKVDPKDLDAFVGKYESANKNLTLEVVKEGTSLIIQVPNVKKDALVPVSENQFTLGESPVRFVKDEKGKVTHLILGFAGKETQLRRID